MECGAANSDELYKQMSKPTDDELRAYVQEAWKQIKRKKIALKAEEVSAYG